MRILARTPALKISRQITSRALFTFTPPRPPPAAMPWSEPLLNHSGSKADYPSGGGSGDVPRPPESGLSSKEAEELLLVHGYNELAEEERNPLSRSR